MTTQRTIQMFVSLAGCRPVQVTFDRPERVVRSMREEGVRYAHPAEHVEATVWVPEGYTVQEVLDYHYPQSYSNLVIITGAMGSPSK